MRRLLAAVGRFELAILALGSYLPLHALRIALVRAAGARLGADVILYHGLQIRRAADLAIGAGTIVGEGAILDARGGLEIGRDVNISSQVHIWTLQHDYRAADFGTTSGPVRVEDHAWLSDRCTVLPGVTVGRGAVVAAGAVVAKDVPPLAVVAGIPAREVGKRPDVLGYSLGREARKAPLW